MYTLGLTRGGCAPLRTPGLSRRCRSNGRTGAQPPNPRTGARTAQRRTAVVAAHLTPAEQVAFDQAAEALGLPNAGERASGAVSGVRELSPGLADPLRGPRRLRRHRRRPLDRPQAGRKPSGRDQSRRRRGLGATPTMKQPALQAPGFWDAERPFCEGSFPAPLYAQKRRVDSPAGGRTPTGPTGFGNSRSVTRETSGETSRGHLLFRTKVAPGVTPSRDGSDSGAWRRAERPLWAPSDRERRQSVRRGHSVTPTSSMRALEG